MSDRPSKCPSDYPPSDKPFLCACNLLTHEEEISELRTQIRSAEQANVAYLLACDKLATRLQDYELALRRIARADTNDLAAIMIATKALAQP